MAYSYCCLHAVFHNLVLIPVLFSLVAFMCHRHNENLFIQKIRRKAWESYIMTENARSVLYLYPFLADLAPTFMYLFWWLLVSPQPNVFVAVLSHFQFPSHSLPGGSSSCFDFVSWLFPKIQVFISLMWRFMLLLRWERWLSSIFAWVLHMSLSTNTSSCKQMYLKVKA